MRRDLGSIGVTVTTFVSSFSSDVEQSISTDDSSSSLDSLDNSTMGSGGGGGGGGTFHNSQKRNLNRKIERNQILRLNWN